MITAAHIGVGILGLEGQQAARSADYSIGQFQFLKNLLFVHGREAYRRNSYLVLYMFYKNLIFVLPIFYYGYYSCFSGTSIYDIFIYQSFNLIYTGMPICWYCTFDQQYKKEVFLQYPQLYKIGLQNQCFNKVVFAKWYFYGIWQSAFILFLSLNALNNVDEYSLDLQGTHIVEAIVLLVTLKIFFSTFSHTFYSILF